MTLHRATAVCLVLAAASLLADPARGVENVKLPADTRLALRFETREGINGVTLTRDGRIFLPVQRSRPDTGMQLGEVAGTTLKPYPDETWNSWKTGQDPKNAFVGVNAIRIGPDGMLWVVDSGIPATTHATVKGGAKVVVIDPSRNRVTRVYPLDRSTNADSFVDDMRINGRRAYLTDAGEKHAGLIVLDLDSGDQRRVLDGDPSVTENGRVLTGEGKALVGPDGKPVVVNADQLEISPDGKTFYFQPCTGPLYKIATALLDDPAATPEQVKAGVSLYADTHSTGGSAIAADGTIYISDTDTLALLKIAPGGAITTLVRDPKLVWVDAMWIDDAGTLWIPAVQMNRRPRMNGGKDDVQPPFQLFSMPIGAKPVRN